MEGRDGTRRVSTGKRDRTESPLLTMGELITETGHQGQQKRWIEVLFRNHGRLPLLVLVDYVASIVNALIVVGNRDAFGLNNANTIIEYQRLMTTKHDEPEEAVVKVGTFVHMCKKHTFGAITTHFAYTAPIHIDLVAAFIVWIKLLIHEEDFDTSMELYKQVQLVLTANTAREATEPYQFLLNAFNDIASDHNEDANPRITLMMEADDDPDRKNPFNKKAIQDYFANLWQRCHLWYRPAVYLMGYRIEARTEETTASVEENFKEIRRSDMVGLPIVDYIKRSLERHVLAVHELQTIVRTRKLNNNTFRSNLQLDAALFAPDSVLSTIAPAFGKPPAEQPTEKWKQGTTKSARTKAMLANSRVAANSREAPPLNTHIVLPAVPPANDRKKKKPRVKPAGMRTGKLTTRAVDYTGQMVALLDGSFFQMEEIVERVVSDSLHKQND